MYYFMYEHLSIQWGSENWSKIGGFWNGVRFLNGVRILNGFDKMGVILSGFCMVLISNGRDQIHVTPPPPPAISTNNIIF